MVLRSLTRMYKSGQRQTLFCHRCFFSQNVSLVARVRLDRGIQQSLPTCEISGGPAEKGINLSHEGLTTRRGQYLCLDSNLSRERLQGHLDCDCESLNVE